MNLVELFEAMETSDYHGDVVYSINCTGDVVVGDEVCFNKATFSGSFRSAKFAGFEKITGKVIKDSYGADKQQHTFTLQRPDGTIFLIKGRVLYREGTWRKPWQNETDRKIVADEKHERGDKARKVRSNRKNNVFEEESEQDQAHRATLHKTGFWGKRGAGCIVLARDTGNLLIAHR